MNLKTVGIVLLLIIGLWFVFSRPVTAPTTPPTPTATTTPEATQTPTTKPSTTETKPSTPTSATVKKALLPFLSNGQSSKCSYETVNGSNRTSSQLYMSKGVLRGEFRTWSGTTATTDFVHYDGTYAYTWKEGSAVGSKHLVNTLADLPSLIPRDLTSGSVLGTATNNASWDCHQWIIEAAKMKLPTYVTFK